MVSGWIGDSFGAKPTLKKLLAKILNFSRASKAFLTLSGG